MNAGTFAITTVNIICDFVKAPSNVNEISLYERCNLGNLPHNL